MGLVSRQRRWGTVVAQPASKQTGRVALIVDQFAAMYNFPSGDLLRGLQDGLGDEIDVVCRESRSDPELEARHLKKLSEESDGILIYPTTHPRNTALMQKIVDSGFPLIVLDRVPPNLSADAVVSDNEEATQRALRALIDRGHRRIGFFSFHKPEFSSVRERYHAYCSALSEAGIEECAEFVRWFPKELDLQSEQFVQAVYDSLFTLLHQPNPMTALFCVQDSFAAASLQACDRMDKKVPNNMELATFNEWPPMMLRSPWLTHRIVQRHHQIGFEAARALLKRIEGSNDPVRTLRVGAEFYIADAGLQPSTRNGFAATFPPETNGGSSSNAIES